MKLGMEVGPGHIALDGDPAPPIQKGHTPPEFSAHVRYGQTAGWIKMRLGTEVDLSPGHIVLDGNPASPSPQKRKGTTSSKFRPVSVVSKRMDQDATW